MKSVSQKRTRTCNTKTRALSRRILAKPPVSLQKRYLEEILRTLKSEKAKVKKKVIPHRLIKDYGITGELALHMCHSPSLKVIQDEVMSNCIPPCTANTLYNLIRKALLNHNWLQALELLTVQLNSNNLTKKNLMYIFRILNITMFNLHVSPEELKYFISVTLGLKNSGEQNSYLKSLFLLPEKLKLGERITNRIHMAAKEEIIDADLGKKVKNVTKKSRKKKIEFQSEENSNDH